jgi:hypothetical protein
MTVVRCLFAILSAQRRPLGEFFGNSRGFQRVPQKKFVSACVSEVVRANRGFDIRQHEQSDADWK